MNGPLPAEEPEGERLASDVKKPLNELSRPGHRWQIAVLSLVVIALLVTFLGIWPAHELLFPARVKMPFLPNRPTRVAWQPDPRTAVRIGLTEGIMCLWFFAFGASMGSFLHVVLYRVPRGESIVMGGSKCPNCNHAIRPTDNLPVIGWLRLGGSCRDCGWPIPFRYPLAELLFGTLYLSLVLLELHLGGPNLPGYTAWPTRLADNLWPHDPTPVFRLLYHLALAHWILLSLLFAADGNRFPRALFWFAVMIGVLAPLAWRGLQPVDWQGKIWLPGVASDLYATATTSVAGLVVGGLAAWRWFSGNGTLASRVIGVSLWLVSVYFGWQLGLVAAGIAVAIDGVVMLLADRRNDFLPLCLVAISISLLFVTWRWLLLIPAFPQEPLSYVPGLLLAISLLPRGAAGGQATNDSPEMLSPSSPSGS